MKSGRRSVRVSRRGRAPGLTNQGTDDGVCGRDWHCVPRRKGKPQGATDDDTGESEETNAGVIRKDAKIDNAVLDRSRDTRADEHCAEELKDGCAEHGLFEGYRPRRDGCCPAVCDIVRSDTVGIQEGKDHRDGKELRNSKQRINR